MKRITDFLISFVGLVITFPLLILLIGIIRASSKGPGLFRQERIGFGGESFVCCKLRTMKVGTKERATHEVSSASVTSIGRFMRATKLDELPQLWNVLKGEMSLVGPRPCLPVQKELIHERKERNVFDVLPGITGLAQVRGVDMSNPRILAEIDAEYVENRSGFLDFSILLKTVGGAGIGDRVRG